MAGERLSACTLSGDWPFLLLGSERPLPLLSCEEEPLLALEFPLLPELPEPFPLPELPVPELPAPPEPPSFPPPLPLPPPLPVPCAWEGNALAVNADALMLVVETSQGAPTRVESVRAMSCRRFSNRFLHQVLEDGLASSLMTRS